MATKKKTKEVDPKVVEAESKSKALLAPVKQPARWLQVPKVRDEMQLTEASSALAWCKSYKKKIDLERKEIVDPLNAVIKKVNARFKEVTKPVDEIQTHLDKIMRQYTDALRAKAERKVEKEAQAAEERGEVDFAMDLRDNAIRTKPELTLAGVHQRDVWKAEVADLSAALVALLEGNASLAPVRADIIEVIERHCSRLATAIKKEDIGVPGVLGVRSTTFVGSRS